MPLNEEDIKKIQELLSIDTQMELAKIGELLAETEKRIVETISEGILSPACASNCQPGCSSSCQTCQSGSSPAVK